MSMTTKVEGFRPPDEEWKKQKAVFDACEAARVAAPKETFDFFDGEPDEQGQVVGISAACQEHSNDMESGILVDLSKLPAGLKFIRFVNSW